MKDYRLITVNGYSEKIGALVWMLENARSVTLDEVMGLNEDKLDTRLQGDGNTIATLLMHIAAIEYVHQILTFEQRDLTEKEYAKWQPALELGQKACEVYKQQPLSYYITVLQQVREQTLTFLKTQHDSWLFEEDKWANGVPINHYYLWYHVLEDEISHRGQIRMMIRQLSENKRH
jgi:uncharacterized damage-inducible protein DinB